MKKLIIATTLAALMTVGCASDQKMPEAAGNNIPVHVGMTKEEVLKALGHKPKSIRTSPRGEVWHYDNVELAAIPFNFGFHPEFKNYIFDNNGILIDFNATQPTK
jgi:hypothetical protein